MSPKKSNNATNEEESTDTGIKEQQAKEPKPKRKCSEKQLAALAEGRKKNPRYIAKQKRLEEEAKAKEETKESNETKQ